MDANEIRSRAVRRYIDAYPSMAKVRGSRVAENTAGGALVVIRAETPAGHEDSEIVFVDRHGEVTLFNTTEELLMHLESSGRVSLAERFLNLPNMAFGLVAVLILAIVALALGGLGDSDAAKALAGIAALAGGYLFGSAKRNQAA